MSWAIAADWPAPRNVRAFTTLRHGLGVSPAPFDRFNLGTRCGDEPGNALENRRLLVEAAGLPSAPAWLRQVHGSAVHHVTETMERDAVEPEADAAVSRSDSAVLAILTADCLPVLLCNEDGTEIGAAHAGWRGLAGGVLEATVAAMVSKPSSVMAWLGPAAGPEAYEVGNEVRDAFVRHDPAAARAFRGTRPGHWLVDLYQLARQRLRDVGVERIHGGGMCTISDASRFFSHRRDGRGGRMATVVTRSGDA